jgi:pSer/pThr/pTyr-binding forkhead associated (FHA) protein
MKLSLLVLTSGKQEGKVLEIKLPQFLIGRDPQCHLRPASALISKRHCALIQKEGKVFIRDFGSTNGTYVNEERVEGERELHNDDQLKVGPVAFAVRLEADKPAATKTPVPPTKPEGDKTAAPALKAPGKPATPSKSDTPAPATVAKSTQSSEEDDLAAMLLSLDDGDSSSTGPAASVDVPDGSTVMDMKLPVDVAAGGQGPNKPGQPAKPTTVGDTRSAAAKILEKMTKRPRS